MKIKKNEIMDYVPIDDTSMAVNNPENGDTHFLEGTAYAIMQEILEGKDSLDALTASLAEKYDAPEDVIRQDVADFLEELIAKKVVLPA